MARSQGNAAVAAEMVVRMSRVPANETPYQKCKRLINYRGKKVIHGMHRMHTLGSQSYERNHEDIVKLRQILHDEVDLLCDKLEPAAKHEVEKDLI